MAIVKVRVPIEVDITYVNKAWGTLRQKKGEDKKFYVIGIFQRGIQDIPGIAIIKAIPNNEPETIEQYIIKNISKGCILYCEENILPASLHSEYEIKELKASDGHANGDLHVNNLKSMWRDLKRNIKRTHVQVSEKHLQLYCDEVAWIKNNRHLSSHEKFDKLLSNCAIPKGKERRTYEDFVK